jgi:hypothetical protein
MIRHNSAHADERPAPAAAGTAVKRVPPVVVCAQSHRVVVLLSPLGAAGCRDPEHSRCSFPSPPCFFGCAWYHRSSHASGMRGHGYRTAFRRRSGPHRYVVHTAFGLPT